MSLSNKELLDKTLFRKDSVLFISMDGKEYEVSNPQFIFEDPDKKRDKTDLYIAYKIVDGTEWPGEVELHEIPDGGRDMSGPPYPIVDFKTVARLLPKEKKEPVFIPEDHPFAAASHSKVYDTGPDYKTHDDKLPIDESQAWHYVINWIRTWPNISNNEIIFHFRNQIKVIPKIESSEPQEKGKYCFGVTGGVHSPIHSFESQEEMWQKHIQQEKLWDDAISIGESEKSRKAAIHKIMKYFSITRLTP